jgi:hypothetical protein
VQMTLVILSLLFGAVLGMRFKAFVLFPAIPVCLALNAGIAAAQGSGLWPAFLAMALSVTGLQLGFLGGVITRYFIATSRTPLPNGAADRPTAASSGSAR